MSAIPRAEDRCGLGDVPVIELRFRCGACGSRNTSVIVSGSRAERRQG